MTSPPAPIVGSPLRALLLLLLLDLGIGLWLKLHNPAALPLYVVFNAPTIGVTGFFWPLLPKDVKDRLGTALAAVLTSPVSSMALLAIGGSLFLASLFFASVTVELLDTSTATNVHVVRGSQSAPDSQAIRQAVALRLNRLSTPRSKVMRIWPTGQKVWLFSPTHVLFRDTTLLPWLPVRVQYPADFAQMASVAVLPGAEIMARLRQHDLRLNLRESDGGAILASELLDTVGSVIGFLPVSTIPAEDSTRWVARLDPAGDTANIALMLRRWLVATRIPATRPLRQGDTVSWEVRSVSDTSRTVQSGRLVLNGSLADLYLKF